MTTRAAINILGDGSVIDITSLGVDTVSVERPSPGKYLIKGTLGMVPPPEGWGYVLNQADAGCEIDISFKKKIITVSVTKEGEPVDLVHSITLHIAVDGLPPVVVPELLPKEPDVLETSLSELARLRALADYAIGPYQDAADIGVATPEETKKLAAWKLFRVELNRVPDQPGYPTDITWPELPT